MWYWVCSGEIIILKVFRGESPLQQSQLGIEDITCPHVGSILSSSVKPAIAGLSAANEWDNEFSTGRWNSYSQVSIKCFVYYINILMNRFLTIFPRFSTPLFFQKFSSRSEGQTSASEHFPSFSKNDRRLSKTTEKDLKMFRPCLHQKNSSIV